MTSMFPPVAPEVVAESVDGLTSRLRRRLDDAIANVPELAATVIDGVVHVTFGADTEVTIDPGPGGVVAESGQVTCNCLLAPRCLHRAAVLGASPVADLAAGEASSDEVDDDEEPGANRAGEPVGPELTGAGPTTSGAATGAVPGDRASRRGALPAGKARAVGEAPAGAHGSTGSVKPPTPAQVAVAVGLWEAMAAIVAAGVDTAGAVAQADLLRAVHAARLAGLYRAEGAALRVVQGVRAARAQGAGHRAADLVAGVFDVLLTTRLIADGSTDPDLVGVVRRDYRPEGTLRVHGLCREPVLTATGYAGVVTHLVGDDGGFYTLGDVRPGSVGRAVGAGTATVALGGSMVDHAQLSRGGLLIAGASVSGEGRLGAGKGVRATPLPTGDWAEGPYAAVCNRSIAQIMSERAARPLSTDPEAAARVDRELVGCDVVVLGPAGDAVRARELGVDASPAGELRLAAALSDERLGFVANLRQIAARPGVSLRVVGRLEVGPVPVLRVLAAGPVPGARSTLRLPPEWVGHADLGYDRLAGVHFARDVPPESVPGSGRPTAAGIPGGPVGPGGEPVPGAGPLPGDRAAPEEGAPEECSPEPGPPAHASLEPALPEPGSPESALPENSSPEPGSPEPASPEPALPENGGRSSVAAPGTLPEAPLWRIDRLVESGLMGGRRALGEAARTDDLRGVRVALERAGLRHGAALVVALVTEADRRERDVFGRLSGADPSTYARRWLAAAAYAAQARRDLMRANAEF